MGTAVFGLECAVMLEIVFKVWYDIKESFKKYIASRSGRKEEFMKRIFVVLCIMSMLLNQMAVPNGKPVSCKKEC